VPRQRAVEGNGVLEVREAERAEAPGVLGRVAGGLVFVDGASARGTHGLDEAALEARVPGLDVLLRLGLVPCGERVVEHQEAALNDRSRVDIFALRDHMVDQVSHAPFASSDRRFSHRPASCFHLGSPQAPSSNPRNPPATRQPRPWPSAWPPGTPLGFRFRLCPWSDSRRLPCRRRVRAPGNRPPFA
jgi:hypothetical protein